MPPSSRASPRSRPRPAPPERGGGGPAAANLHWMASASFSRAGEAALGGARARRPARQGGALAASARVRWDRVGRVALLCVLVVLVFLYASAGFHMFSKWRQSRHDGAAVAR